MRQSLQTAGGSSLTSGSFILKYQSQQGEWLVTKGISGICVGEHIDNKMSYVDKTFPMWPHLYL